MPEPRWLTYVLAGQTVSMLSLLDINGWRPTFARLVLVCCVGLTTIGLIRTSTQKGNK
jgi:hypothetical protein